MNQKIEITKQILNILGIESDETRIRKTIPVWWYSTRKKDHGGLRLTDLGFQAFQKAGIKTYKIKVEDQIHFTNQLIIWIDRFIDCPFYIKNKDIYVFSEKMAVQLVLFSGNVYQYSSAKARTLSS
jgi:hypothetical protein